MRRQVKKRFGIAVSIAMLFPLIPNIGLTAHADEIKTVAGVGTNAIGNPSSSGGGWSYVYYGEYNGSPVKYRVLDKNSADFGGSTLLLDCDTIIIDKAFDDSNDKNNVWGENSLSTWLNNDYITDSFTPVERTAIFSSTKSEPSSDDGNGWWNPNGLAGSGPFGLTFAPLSSQKIFLLDAKEATRPSYGYLDNSIADSNRVKSGNTSTYWWLRSPHSSNKSNAGYVYPNVYIRSIGVNSNFGVSPAMNIDLSSVLFSSLITGTAGESGAEYKLTIIDDNLSFDITEGSKITQSGTTFTVPYTVTNDEVNNVAATQVSLLITDKEYTDDSATVLEYSQLSTASASESSGVVNYTLDTDKLNGVFGQDYHVYMFAEAVNSTYKTDYASQLLEITHIHDITYSLSEDESSVTASCNNINCDLTDGLTLTISAPEETDLVYDGTEKQASLNTDYNIELFPDTYVIEYYKDSDKLSSAPVDAGTYKAQVTVGKETAYVEYEIAKADQDAPELSSTNETSDGENDGTIIGLTEAMEISTESDTSGYEAVTDISGTGYAAGTYYVRYAADDNHNASPARTIIIDQGEAVYFTVTFDNNDNTNKKDVRVKRNDYVTKPAEPTKEGYKFLFWSENGTDKYDFSTPVTADLTLTAVWKKAPVYETNSVTWTKGSREYGIFTVTCTNDDDKLFDYFKSIEVDGYELQDGDYDVYKGSLRAVLTPSYLELLGVGTHDVEIFFNDPDFGVTSALATLTIQEKGESGSGTGVYHEGDTDMLYRTGADTPAPSLVAPIYADGGKVTDADSGDDANV
ncbi:MAG: InlB B-repeat-containing protein, partial [Oscillospiraceae bacterium]|nr:InlB B-repeat-containing protein [Oscillospiraceae bacterium]